MMRYPSPLLDPIISAEIVHISAIPTPIFTPDTITGNAEGRVILRNISASDAPSVCAASISTFGVLLTPSNVYTSIGNTHPINMMNIAGAIPIPNHNILNGIHAIGGIGLNTLITILENLSSDLKLPSSIPNGIPTTDANPKPMNTLITVFIVSLNNLPLSMFVYADWNTSIGPGSLVVGINPKKFVKMYHTIIMIAGSISGIKYFSLSIINQFHNY